MARKPQNQDQETQGQQIRFLVDYFASGDLKYRAGEVYPVEEETPLCEVAKGNAEFVDAE